MIGIVWLNQTYIFLVVIELFPLVTNNLRDFWQGQVYIERNDR